jgi:EF-hand domain pair
MLRFVLYLHEYIYCSIMCVFEQMLQDDREMFNAADKNKDGVLDKKEFPLFSSPEEHPEMHEFILRQTLDEKDSDKDGFITFQEFVGDKGIKYRIMFSKLSRLIYFALNLKLEIMTRNGSFLKKRSLTLNTTRTRTED